MILEEEDHRHGIVGVAEPTVVAVGGHRAPAPTLVDRTVHFEGEGDHLLHPRQNFLPSNSYFQNPFVAHLVVLRHVMAAVAVAVVAVAVEVVLQGHHILHSSCHFDPVS